MPGLFGIIARTPLEDAAASLQMMRQSLCHQPHFKSGEYSVPEMGVYGGWVAHPHRIVDALVTHDDGEGAALLWSGECFPDSSGAEARILTGREILCRYEKSGADFVAALNGLFAGLVIDPRRRKVLLFNDRYGVERVYFCWRDETLFFASEAKALLAVLPETRNFDTRGLEDFVCYGCVLDERTLFQGIRQLPAASIWEWRAGSAVQQRQYFHPSEWENQEQLSPELFEDALADLLQDTMPAYQHATGGVGLSLTGGLDTRMLCASMSQPAELSSYTFAGDSERLLDLRLARRVAQHCEMDHQVLRVDSAFLDDYAAWNDLTVRVTDGCAGALQAHEIYLCRQARDIASTRLTGNFGSEILRGMTTFKSRTLHPDLLAASSARPCTEKYYRHPVSFAAFCEVPWNLAGSMQAGKSQLTFRTPYLNNALVALAYRAPDSTRSAGRSALSCVYKLDPELAHIPTDRGLRIDGGIVPILQLSFETFSFKLDYWRAEGMPPKLGQIAPLLEMSDWLGQSGRHKYLLYRHWFADPLQPYLWDVLSQDRLASIPGINPGVRDPLLNDHCSGRTNRLWDIHILLTLEAVDRLLLRRPSRRCEGEVSAALPLQARCSSTGSHA